MNKESYIKISDGIRKLNNGEKIVKIANNVLTLIVYICFVGMAGYSLFCNREWLIRMLLVTGISFVVVSVVRHVLNMPRPYTVYDFEPVVKKDKKGDSMPSRHVFSAFIIGMAGLDLFLPLGIIILADGVLMCFERVIAGVHFPKDVVAGAIIGILCGYIGFFVA